MMMVQVPVVLLIKAVRPVSLFRTMLADGTGTGAVGTVGHCSIAAVLLLLVLLLLLQKEVMLLLVMGVGQPTATGCHTQLLLLLVTAGGQVLLTVVTSWH